MAVNQVETAYHNQIETAASFEPDQLEAALDQGTAILQRYLTFRDRAYGGRMGSIGWPPGYDPD